MRQTQIAVFEGNVVKSHVVVIKIKIRDDVLPGIIDLYAVLVRKMLLRKAGAEHVVRLLHNLDVIIFFQDIVEIIVSLIKVRPEIHKIDPNRFLHPYTLQLSFLRYRLCGP